MDREVRFCSIETLKSKEGEYHKLAILTSKAMILLTSLKEKDKEKNLFRTDLVKQKHEVLTVYAHQKALILDRYDVLQN